MNIAYVRVSTVEQNEARQIEALEIHNIDKWFKRRSAQKIQTDHSWIMHAKVTQFIFMTSAA